MSLPFKHPGEHTQRAKELRHLAPEPERRLWKALSGLRNETGLHFRRQHPLPPYFADFACVKAKLVIELDGMSHDTLQVYDAKRDEQIRKSGWMILRFRNQDIVQNLDGVVLQIIQTARQRLHLTHPYPLPQGREGDACVLSSNLL